MSLFPLLIWEMSLFFMSKRLANPDVFSLFGNLVQILLRMFLKKKGKESLLLKSSNIDCAQKENHYAYLLIWAGSQGLFCHFAGDGLELPPLLEHMTAFFYSAFSLLPFQDLILYHIPALQ